MGKATIACLQNTRNFMWQAMCGAPGVRKGRQITSETEPDIVVDRIEKSTSSDSQHRTTSSTISFSYPEGTAVKEFELHESQMSGKLWQTNKS